MWSRGDHEQMGVTSGRLLATCDMVSATSGVVVRCVVAIRIHGIAFTTMAPGRHVRFLHADEAVVKPKQQLQSFAFAPPLSATKREIIFVVKDGSIGAGPLPASPNVS